MLYKNKKQGIKETMRSIRDRYAAVSIFRAMVFCGVRVV